jgi:hypothetical protein
LSDPSNTVLTASNTSLAAIELRVKALENAHPDPKPASAKFLITQVNEWLKLAGAAYAIGFIVIMVHTARLNSPVVEAFEFQNIIAGLPIWILLCIGLLAWPKLRQDIAFGSADRGSKATLVAVLLSLPCLVLLIFRQLRWIGAQLSTTDRVLLIFPIIFFATLLLAFLTAQSDWKSPIASSFKALMLLLSVYAGALSLIIAYAVYEYPRIPQSFGGGKPAQIRVFYKDHGLTPILGGAPAEGEQAQPSDPVALYYRTKSYLLVKTPKDPSLIQIPMDQVRSIVWLESRELR